jgi:hypothetical protein
MGLNLVEITSSQPKTHTLATIQSCLSVVNCDRTAHENDRFPKPLGDATVAELRRQHINKPKPPVNTPRPESTFFLQEEC